LPDAQVDGCLAKRAEFDHTDKKLYSLETVHGLEVDHG